MAKLVYVTNVSLDGYIEDEEGSFAWTEPDDELFVFITDLVRPVGTYLYGRRLYESMAVWETEPALAAQSELMADFASVWQAADKVVYSKTLDADSTSVRAIKAAATSDLTVGRAGGRVPPAHPARPRRRRQTSTTEWRPRRPRAPGRTPGRQRCRLPPLRRRHLSGNP